MDRKESLKTLLLGSVSLPFLKGPKQLKSGNGPETTKSALPMRSDWARWPDMPWVGPRFWGNRLQDWQVAGGKVECTVSGPNRSLHCLTHQLDDRHGDFTTSVEVEMLNKTKAGDGYIGLRLGARAKDDPCRVTFTDYRRAAIYGEGLDAGITGAGRLFIGEETSKQAIAPASSVRLELKGGAEARSYKLMLSAVDSSSGKQLDKLTVEGINPDDLVGNVALISHFTSDAGEAEKPSARFSDWQLKGSKVAFHAGQVYGPILFAQYTLNRGIVKLTAQLTPVETISGHTISLQIREKGSWETLEETTVDSLSRTAHFRVEDWSFVEDIPYRIRLQLPLKDKTEVYYYEGTVASDPGSENPLKAAVFSCNKEHGFPDTEVVENVSKHQPDMAMFLGDQFYESFGGFGVERSHDLEKATLDYLRKWYMFGWSYREIFRHIPSLFIPDDHDVFHGNLWGQGGKKAPTDDGWGYQAQDQGGYKYPPEWVRMVERSQTSHLPDPWDPTPVSQDIGVYYTDWTYGGVSMAIFEDRKFKTAPDNALPFEVVNGFPQDPDIDLSQYYDVEADLLGERQEQFLEEWVTDWSNNAQMKVVLSQSPFCGAHTLPEGATSDRIAPRRPVPAKGEYPEGDVPAPDMDTNGWPSQKRDKALRIIRKSFALHIAGDQHLASVIQYGIDAFRDSGFVFTLPALNNTFPRRWWPHVDDDHQPLPGRPPYTGDFNDAFGNRITVLSMANPVQTNRKPAIIYDRATGYGIVHFDTENRTMRIECWPRYVDPLANPEGQYDGWPITVDQQDNDGREPAGYLPEIRVVGLEDPVLQLYNEETDELEYALRIQGDQYTPKVFVPQATYTVRIGDPDEDQWQEHSGLRAADEKPIVCRF